MRLQQHPIVRFFETLWDVGCFGTSRKYSKNQNNRTKYYNRTCPDILSFPSKHMNNSGWHSNPSRPPVSMSLLRFRWLRHIPEHLMSSLPMTRSIVRYSEILPLVPWLVLIHYVPSLRSLLPLSAIILTKSRISSLLTLLPFNSSSRNPLLKAINVGKLVIYKSIPFFTQLVLPLS